MGFFDRTPPSRHEPASWDITQTFPSASSDQLATMTSIWTTVLSELNGGSWTPQRVAAISTLCDRLVAENPQLTAFVDALRDVASRESALHPSDPSWRALERHL